MSAAVRVLVVEDVAVNRELVRLMLEPSGYSVDDAGDGRAAVEAVRATSYDIVLMDMHMPVMDGLEATRAIRAMGGAWAGLPIIGLSANVIPEQIERCLAAGMSGHFAKPFQAEQLRAEVARWIGRPSQASAPAPTPTPIVASPAETERVRLQGLFLDLLDVDLDAAACDAQTYRRRIHDLRGAAGMLGHAALSRAARDLEDALRMKLPTHDAEAALRGLIDDTRTSVLERLAPAA